MTVVIRKSIADLSLWKRLAGKRIPFSFELEITARCNNNCTHCYINRPAADKEAKRKEFSLHEIENLADQAIELGSLWCLLTGGEPLLRKDFAEIYTLLRRKGLLVSLFTNAVLINGDHIRLFRRYPPREIEVTVYGASREVYERVTRVPGSYDGFIRGLNLLKENRIPIRLKTTIMRSNVDEMGKIAEFCRRYTKDYFRFDPLIHLRYDRDKARNREIIAERLTPQEIVRLELGDPERSSALLRSCDDLVFDRSGNTDSSSIFFCGAGKSGFSVSYDGKYRLCPSLWHDGHVYDLRRGTLREAWMEFTPRVLQTTSGNPEYRRKCRNCDRINLCMWCPAIADLETGKLDQWVEYFCRVAHARAEAIGKQEK